VANDVTLPHLMNLVVHVGAGVVGMALGTVQLIRTKGDVRHRRFGRLFMFAALTVTGSALVGTLAFRFMPLFAVLTVLTTYVAVGGWRVAHTRERGPERIDLAWTLIGIGLTAALLPVVLDAPKVGNTQPIVVWSTLGALGFVLTYDLLRWVFPRRWFERIWLPEHVYKVFSALFGMVSAFVGNVIPWGQPWSQVAPSIVGTLLILYWGWRSAVSPPSGQLRGPPGH
jgi:uncharacterized membrane protein